MNPSICEFEGDADQVYEAFQLPEGDYIVRWKTSNGTTEVVYTPKEVAQALKDGDWIVKF